MHDLTLGAFPFLTSLAASESPRDRRIWLRVASDHFVASQASDPEAIERFAEAMAPRLNTADALTRLEIARKLAPCAQTPRKLLALFESFDSEICRLSLNSKYFRLGCCACHVNRGESF